MNRSHRPEEIAVKLLKDCQLPPKAKQSLSVERLLRELIFRSGFDYGVVRAGLDAAVSMGALAMKNL